MKKKIEKQTWLKIATVVGIVVAILVIDLVSKYVLEATLHGSVRVIGGLFNFVEVQYNYGGAYNLLSGELPFLIGISVVFVVAFTWYYCKEKKKTWLLTVAYSFLLGGCLGNLYDRIVLGRVRDFIEFDFWKSFPVFNFADIFLTFGVILFVIYLILFFCNERKEEKKVIVEDVQDSDFEPTEEDAQTRLLDEKCKKIDEISTKNAKKIEKMQKKQEKTSNDEQKLNRSEGKDES